jgi:hypothetical protein
MRDVRDGYVPNVATRSVGANPRTQILMLIGGAAMVRFAAGMGVYEKDAKTNLVRPGLKGVPWVAFIAVYITMAIAADFDATVDLAVIFSLLLFVTILINYGVKASDNLMSLINHQPSFKEPVHAKHGPLAGGA